MKLTRRLMITGLAVALSGRASSSAEPIAFDADRFAVAQAANKSILLHVTAPWCGTCKAQKPIVSNLGKQPDFAELAIFEIDFDSSKDLLRSFNVQSQSTMIAFRGKTEVGRTVADTDPSSIEALFRKTL